MAGFVPLEIECWSNFSRVITVRAADGSSQNLVGYQANTLMRRSHYSTSSNTITTQITDASNGQITLSMTPANTGLLTPGRFVYDTTTTTPGGIVQRMIEGIIYVSPGVTH
jgi:archaellum component FlaF (FlaF/FlaG flagellin family)